MKATAYFLFAAALSWFGSANVYASTTTSLCLVPVLEGRATAEDAYQGWRMARRVEVLPDLPLPVIYPQLRDGIWTIDLKNKFVRFGGLFPANFFWDVFARFPQTGDILGVNPHLGVFVAHPGKHGFTELYKSRSLPFLFPRLWQYAPRLGGMLILDRGKLYVIDETFFVRQLAFVDLPEKTTLEPPIDLPEIKAMLISAHGVIYLREDTGSSTTLMTLDHDEYPTAAQVLDDGTLQIRTNRQQYSLTLRRDSQNLVVASSVAAEPKMEST